MSVSLAQRAVLADSLEWLLADESRMPEGESYTVGVLIGSVPDVELHKVTVRRSGSSIRVSLDEYGTPRQGRTVLLAGSQVRANGPRWSVDQVVDGQ